MISYGMKDRVICITGGASGIGRATALAAAKDGAHLAILDQRQEDIGRVLEEIRAWGVKAVGHALDVRDAAATADAARQIESGLGPVYALFASAGISRTSPAEKIREEDFDAVMDVNLKGLVLSCRELGRAMIGRGEGAIVLVGSIDGLGGHPGRLAYVASKYAVTGVTKNLALEWGRHGVRVNAVMPGFVDTPLLRANMPEGYIANVVMDRTPLGRMARAEEIASVAMMMLSDGASYMNGAIVPVDGGMTAGYLTRARGGDYASMALLNSGDYVE